MLRATGDIRKVALWLGHASVTSSEVYLRSDPDEKLEVLEKLLPLQLRRGAPGHGRPGGADGEADGKIVSMVRSSTDQQAEIPILESGDRLTRVEFERRYEARPDIQKAELIEGVVYVASPTRYRHHGRPHALVLTWLGYYAARTPGLEVCDNGTVRMDPDNEPQPDAVLRLPEELGGQSRVDADDYLRGAPEFIAEVAASSASYDAGPKKSAYRRNAVQEYLLWRVVDRAIDWFSLREGVYEPMPRSLDGLFHSSVFPGLWLDPEALIEGRLHRLLEVVDQGFASPEHEAFLARLKSDSPA